MAITATQSTVTRIELTLISLPFDAGRRDTAADANESIDTYNASSRTFTEMQSLLVSVHTSDGLTGWGEAFGHKTNPATWAALQDVVAPFFVGRAADPVAVRHDAEYAFHAFGRTGPVHYALSAIDTALWDLAAQRAGQPLRHLLAEHLGTGGPDHPVREAISSYASLVHYGEDPVEVDFHVRRAAAAGFAAFKLHESTREAIAAARQAAGGHPLMVDVNCHWDLEGAHRAADAFTDLDLHWLEEPIFPPDDAGALAALNARHGYVAAGENASGAQGLIDQMAAGAVAVAQPSVGKIGGITDMLEVYAAGARLGVAVVPHNFYYGPALVATAQLIAAAPRQRAADGTAHPELEVPFLSWPRRLHPLHAAHHDAASADVVLPEAPGLGFAPDPEVLAAATLRTATVA
ncbi:mandelate racemase/muconate lactonizing enzyme family protein [Zhihengliuella flava]|uniref:L-alanine-DL-glutamate epimerase-like enolase superfamily enzyme n=1 Tax=Zhihengliuella flava TaxID=1285193 RepID=A0A931DB62_9MICC|nr:mandelate racemase/muconate lactonizing enzyme family protein [Zhihengliuella flava]MBG6084316.1 L-alanine-DL-glutamate epimerase-like enolase superfamily enzyme [Zhihengliuella flava]